MGVSGVPETITHNNGPPYNIKEWKKKAERQNGENTFVLYESKGKFVVAAE